MHKAKDNYLSKAFLTLIFSLFSLIAFCQPPVVNPTGGVDPATIDPKNLTPTQLTGLLTDKNSDAGKDKNEKYRNSKNIDKDSLGRSGEGRNDRSGIPTFGDDVFSSAAVTDLSELSTPPLDYPIGVGDIIVVAGWGAADFQNEYIVARDGAIFPSLLGKINVAGLNFDNMRNIVDARFRSVVPGGTNISVTLGQPRSINVNVVGEVNNPGPVTVSAFSNAFNVIAKAGGGSGYADLRNILIKRNGIVIDQLDVYKYLTTGEFGKKQYLQNGDFVIVGVYKKKVLASGQFKRPMYYQLKENEGVAALLFFTGGLKPDALASNMKITRSENERQIVKDVNANAIIKIAGQDFKLEDGDIVNVGLIKPGVINKVEIRGEVLYPNFYEVRPGDRIFDVINRAGGVTANTYLNRAYIFRGAGDSTKLSADKIELDLSDYNNTSSLNNVLLKPNDIIQLFSTSEFTEANYVEIFGEVRKEGKVNKYGGMTLQDLIYLSGGLKPTAEFGRLEIASVVDVDSAKAGLRPTRTVIRTYAITSDLNLDSVSARILLRPFDQVFVRKNPSFELQQNITMSGLVKYPGKYAKLSSNERISSFVLRAGGVKDNANLSGAVLFRVKTDMFRESVVKPKVITDKGEIRIDSTAQILNKAINDPVSIDLYKAMRYKNSKYDITLQENDVIFVPEVNPFVSVEGRVQSPLKIAFDKEHTNLLYYIDKAGGFGVKPWRNRIYVKYANGRSRRTRNFGFLHFYPKVKEGSFVLVPEKPAGQELADVAKSIFVSLIPIVLTTIVLRSIN